VSANTKIEWATKTWNPLRGCSKVSEGCRNCYAIRQAHRFSGPGKPYEGLTERMAAGVNWTGKIRLVPEALDEPLRWRRPERVFVNSMSDLFHPTVVGVASQYGLWQRRRSG
jgi:protein gp37